MVDEVAVEVEVEVEVGAAVVLFLGAVEVVGEAAVDGAVVVAAEIGIAAEIGTVGAVGIIMAAGVDGAVAGATVIRCMLIITIHTIMVILIPIKSISISKYNNHNQLHKTHNVIGWKPNQRFISARQIPPLLKT